MPEEFSADKKVPDLSVEMPAFEGMEADEEIILARDLTGALIKSVKAFRFYPPNNPTLKGFRDQLLKKFQFFLNKYEVFVMKVGEYDLSFKGKIVYENRDPKSSLAYLLYQDGLKEIRFRRGIEEREIQGLMDIFKLSESIDPIEEDMVTLMWEMDFTHIGYLATDEFLEEVPVLIPENIDQFRQNLVFKPLAQPVQADLAEDDSGEEVNQDVFSSRGGEEPSLIVLDRSVYLLTSEDVEGLSKDVEAEIDPLSVFHITDILFEILALEKEREPFQDAVNTLVKILDTFLRFGQFTRAADLLKRVTAVLKSYDLRDWQMDLVRSIITEAGEEARIERIRKVLEKEGTRLEDVNTYLLLLQKNAVKPLIRLLGEIKNSKARRVICDALSHIGKNAIELFIPFMDDRRWYLVRNITYILGRIGNEQSLPYIQKAFHHEEIRVRREAIQALGFISGPKAISLIVRALTDGDVRIRCMAAINLGKVGKKLGLVPLLEVVQAKDFYKRESVEIKAFFNAIGMIGSNEAIPVLQQLLERKSWLTPKRNDEIGIGAAQALAMIGTPKAKVILEEGKRSKQESVRNACAQAVKSSAP